MAKIKRFPLGTFMKQFSTEAQCREYLADLRWKSGYVCRDAAAVTHKFSQDCSIEAVLHLVMAHFDRSKEEAQAEIDEYFQIVEG